MAIKNVTVHASECNSVFFLAGDLNYTVVHSTKVAFFFQERISVCN